VDLTNRTRNRLFSFEADERNSLKHLGLQLYSKSPLFGIGPFET
jgi:hypothetical protein